jgi:uncharacterized protein YrzB (UPF0473 family)
MNEEKKIITLIDEHGGRTEAEVVIAFKVDATGKEYIIYTKNEIDESGNVTVYVSAMEEVNGVKQLTGIASDEEWQQIKEIIKQLAKEVE